MSLESNISAGVYNMRSTNKPLNMLNTGRRLLFLDSSLVETCHSQIFRTVLYTPQDNLIKTTTFQLRQNEIEKFIKIISLFIVSHDDVYSILISYYSCYSFTCEL